MQTPNKQGDDGWKSTLYEGQPLETFRRKYFQESGLDGDDVAQVQTKSTLVSMLSAMFPAHGHFAPCNNCPSLTVACLGKLASVSWNAGSMLTWTNQHCMSAPNHLSTERQTVHVSHVSSHACLLPCIMFASITLSWAVRVESCHVRRKRLLNSRHSSQHLSL